MMIFNRTNKFKWAAVLAGSFLFTNAGAFVLKTYLGQCRPLCGSNNEISAVVQCRMMPSNIAQDLNIMRSMIEPSVSSSFMVSDAMAIVTNILIGVGGIATLLVLFGFLATSYIIPTAVKQVETLAKDLDPDLWIEYQQKLGPDETLATRPDLLEELGSKVVQLQQEQFENEMGKLDAELKRAGDEIKGSSEASKSGADTVIDVDTTTTSNKWDD